jgi:hypothetical protein
MDPTVLDARGWAEALLAREYRGPGDTIDAAMHRAETRHGIPAETFWALRYRPPKDIVARTYFRLKAAYQAEVSAQEARLRHEIEMTRKVRGDAAAAALLDEAEALLGKTGGEK